MKANNPAPVLSVVIPTLGRTTLVRTLESLVAARTSEQVEIIVVGTIRDASVEQAVKGILSKHPYARWLSFSFASGDSSQKKNAGFREARAPIVAFLDDDVIVAEDWPERILEPFTDTKVGLVSGPGLVPDELPWMAHLAGAALSSKAAGYVAQRYRTADARPYPVKWSRLIGCNMAYRRNVLEEIGLFDPDFWPGEEMLAAYRATSRGYLLIFHPQARVYHFPRQTLMRFLRQMFGYGATRIRLIRAGVEFEPTTVVPMLWVLSLVILIPWSLIHAMGRWLLAANLLLYGLADLYTALDKFIETRRFRDWGLLGLIPLMHVAYGIGAWVEFFRPNRDLSEKSISSN